MRCGIEVNLMSAVSHRTCSRRGLRKGAAKLNKRKASLSDHKQLLQALRRDGSGGAQHSTACTRVRVLVRASRTPQGLASDTWRQSMSSMASAPQPQRLLYVFPAALDFPAQLGKVGGTKACLRAAIAR
jgi:hypothetical protein